MNSDPQDWLERFPALDALTPEERRLLRERSQMAELPAHVTAFSAGSAAENYLLVVEGVVRVQQVSESGREIVLYRVSGGETCILTTACLLAHEQYMAEGITETPVTAVILPKRAFDQLLASSQVFRDFVFSAYSSRITDLLLLVEEVAFTRIDSRLAQRLLDLSGTGAEVRLTHQELAVELGTAREVISRQLKEFERRGWLRLERGLVSIQQRGALGDLASHD